MNKQNDLKTTMLANAICFFCMIGFMLTATIKRNIPIKEAIPKPEQQQSSLTYTSEEPHTMMIDISNPPIFVIGVQYEGNLQTVGNYTPLEIGRVDIKNCDYEE